MHEMWKKKLLGYQKIKVSKNKLFYKYDDRWSDNTFIYCRKSINKI